jgi:redox-sensitive bicupin YhaK (pirin superfamily)
MIKNRAAKECGNADFGWLQARYTFSFGHYFDPDLLGYASLRVLNQEVLAPGASFLPRTYPQVDILNIILQGSAEYRDSLGNTIQATTGEAVLLSTREGISYSEHNLNSDQPLTRMQLWLDACPQQDNPLRQHCVLQDNTMQLLASPEGEEGSLQLRQQVWIHLVSIAPEQSATFSLRGPRAYLQSIYGQVATQGNVSSGSQHLQCGDGAFIHQEQQITLCAKTPLRALLIDLPV